MKANKGLEADKIQQHKSNITLLRQEKDRIIKEKKEEEKKVGILTKEKNELTTSQNKMEQKYIKIDKELQDLKKEHEVEKGKLLQEINNQNREVDIHMKMNTKIREECEMLITKIREQEGDKIAAQDTVPRESLPEAVNTDTAEELERDIIQENERLKNKLTKLKEELKEQKKLESQHKEEINTLKVQTKEYHERLENILTSMSQTEREKEHLTDGMNALKAMNLSLVEELGKANCAKEKTDVRDSTGSQSTKKVACRRSENCPYWKQKRCYFGHDKEYNAETDHTEANKGGPKKVEKEIVDIESVETRKTENTDNAYINNNEGDHNNIQTNGNNDESTDQKETLKRHPMKSAYKRMCPDGKTCNQQDKCSFQHDCNYIACKQGTDCKFIHKKNRNDGKIDLKREEL